MSLEIRLDNNFTLSSNSYGYKLDNTKPSLSKDGVEGVSICRSGNYSTIVSALEGYLNHSILNSECKSIQELIDLVQLTKEEIRGVYKINKEELMQA